MERKTKTNKHKNTQTKKEKQPRRDERKMHGRKMIQKESEKCYGLDELDLRAGTRKTETRNKGS